MSDKTASIVPAHIILSRKNVESLLHMLDHRDKQRPALVKGNGLIVEVQENDDYYKDRTPGVMSWERSNSIERGGHRG